MKRYSWNTISNNVQRRSEETSSGRKSECEKCEIGKKESCLKYNTPTHDMINCFSHSGYFVLLLKPEAVFGELWKQWKVKHYWETVEIYLGIKGFDVFNYLYCFALSSPNIKAFHHFFTFQFTTNFLLAFALFGGELFQFPPRFSSLAGKKSFYLVMDSKD